MDRKYDDDGNPIYTSAEKKKFHERLLKLADYLEGPVAAAVKAKKVTFDMTQWSSKKVKKELSCGTAACAAGYATTLFARQGFTLTEIYGDYTPVFKGMGGFEACEEFFGVQDPFSPDWYDENDMKPTIKNVVRKLRMAAAEFAA